MAGAYGRRRGKAPPAWIAVLLVAALVAFGIAMYADRGHRTPQGCHYYGAIERCTPSPSPTGTDPFPADPLDAP